MIGKIKGILDSTDPEKNIVIIDVGGVGYLLICSQNTIAKLPDNGGNVSLVVETHVREDHIHLYGFHHQTEKEAFLLLNKVSGVGTKMAIAILSILSPEQINMALAAQDSKVFTQVSGVGPKLATRIVNELKDKFNLSGTIDVTNFTASTKKSATNNNIQDAVLALTSLGYAKVDAFAAIGKIAAANDQMPLDLLVKEGLKMLGNN